MDSTEHILSKEHCSQTSIPARKAFLLVKSWIPFSNPCSGIHDFFQPVLSPDVAQPADV
jgi:hypothetical protein